MNNATVVLVHGAFADGSSWGKVIALLEKAGYDVIAVGKAGIERVTRLGAQPMPEEMVDLGDHRRWNDQAAGFLAYDSRRTTVPRVAAIVVRVNDARVEDNGHLVFTESCGSKHVFGT